MRAVYFKALNEENGIKSTFINRSAKWHKSCSLDLNATKLNRAHKRANKKFNNKESIMSSSTSCSTSSEGKERYMNYYSKMKI